MVGDGKNIYFWDDRWMADPPMSRRFLNLDHLLTMKICWMADVLVFLGSIQLNAKSSCICFILFIVFLCTCIRLFISSMKNLVFFFIFSCLWR